MSAGRSPLSLTLSPQAGRGRKFAAPAAILAIVLFPWIITGCGAGPKKPEQKTILDAGFAALESQQYNEAISKAEAFLSENPHGPGSAEALYLKGRGLEGKNTAGVDETEAKANLQAARQAYIEALEQSPRQPLEAYIRTSLANVAYFQEDYQTALSQWSTAIDHLDPDEVKAWALYRIGRCHQRLGRFDQADRVFADVQSKYPNTKPASLARDHQGMRGFYVQLATFASQATAQKAAADLAREGVAASIALDSQNHHTLRVPAASYGQALYLKGRFAGRYPDAMIVP